MTKKQFINAIKQNKISVLAFLVGYLMFISNLQQVYAIRDVILLMPRWFQIFSSIIFIFFSAFVVKIEVKVYKSQAILKNDSLKRKIWKSLIIISIGAFIGFLTNVLQGYTLALLGGIFA